MAYPARAARSDGDLLSVQAAAHPRRGAYFLRVEYAITVRVHAALQPRTSACAIAAGAFRRDDREGCPRRAGVRNVIDLARVELAIAIVVDARLDLRPAVGAVAPSRFVDQPHERRGSILTVTDGLGRIDLGGIEFPVVVVIDAGLHGDPSGGALAPWGKRVDPQQ
jgi:hypothetical protein